MAALLGGVGSCIGIGAAASKGAGVLAEKPSLFGKILILSALPGSQGVYGLLIAIFILSSCLIFSEILMLLEFPQNLKHRYLKRLVFLIWQFLQELLDLISLKSVL